MLQLERENDGSQKGQIVQNVGLVCHCYLVGRRMGGQKIVSLSGVG